MGNSTSWHGLVVGIWFRAEDCQLGAREVGIRLRAEGNHQGAGAVVIETRATNSELGGRGVGIGLRAKVFQSRSKKREERNFCFLG